MKHQSQVNRAAAHVVQPASELVHAPVPALARAHQLVKMSDLLWTAARIRAREQLVSDAETVSATGAATPDC